MMENPSGWFRNQRLSDQKMGVMGDPRVLHGDNAGDILILSKSLKEVSS